MIKILKAKAKDSLTDEWHKVSKAHYGKKVDWDDKEFRFKAEVDGKLAGLIEGKHASGVVYISSIITAEDYRNMGVGTALVQKAEQFGQKLGAHKLWLITGKHWSENKFYQKLNFVKVADLPDFHFHKDFVIYTKDIGV